MKTDRTVQIIECPRDAMQGWFKPIPTALKAEYLNSLLQVGFHTLDFGSFVSPKAIPQMADTRQVLEKLDLSSTNTKLLAIVANERGASDACAYDQISYLGFPFSVSPTFQQRNTNSSQEDSLERVSRIQELCRQHRKELVVYLSMGFGNPYGDTYNDDVLMLWAGRMADLGITILSLADTVGLASAAQVQGALRTLIPMYPDIEFGVHLHAASDNWASKLDAALKAGCLRFDGALKGIGGCPMAGNTLVGNMDTINMISHFQSKGLQTGLNEDALTRSIAIAARVFQ